MPHTITIPDDTYQRLEQVAAEHQEAPGDLLARWLTEWLDQGKLTSEHLTDVRSSWTVGFLSSLGLDDELIAHVLATPEEQRGRELRLALTALADEQVGPPRAQTFEEFFHDLGMTREQIADAQRRGAERANL